MSDIGDMIQRGSTGPPWEQQNQERCMTPEKCRDLERELGAARDQLAAVTRERDTAIQHMSQQSRDAGLLEAEVERLTRERDALRGLDASHNDEYRELRAEVERLRVLLRECHTWLIGTSDAPSDVIDPVLKRIRAALGEGA